MDVGADQYHPAIFYIFFHCPSKTSLGIFSQLISLVDDQHFKTFSIFRLDIAISCYLFDDILDDMSIIVVVI
jgi:hypothetical protein